MVIDNKDGAANLALDVLRDHPQPVVLDGIDPVGTSLTPHAVDANELTAKRNKGITVWLVAMPVAEHHVASVVDEKSLTMTLTAIDESFIATVPIIELTNHNYESAYSQSLVK